MSNNSVYELVTNKIIEKLEGGIIPWRKPWVSGGAVSWKTQKAYRGINVMLLEPGEYATFKQITEAGGKVKKGEKSHIVVFWKWLEIEDKESKEIEKVPMLRYYRVFEINSQVEGLTSKREEKTFEHDPIETAEEIFQEYLGCPSYSWNPGEAFYLPARDHINVPPMKDFESAEAYYSTMFHEMVHSTGHESRLKRDGVTGKHRFGSEDYSKEELVAEIGAAMLCGKAGIVNRTIDNTAAYIKSWLRVLQDDKTMVVSAAAQAQKAADHILGVKWLVEE
ncbi:ArdC family protein [Lysinibacillus fusiformis]|uniref:ArdC family protein n=1 Tax=Lysinibacillus fusiformis TaxID=28031 RepID=UPI003D067094